MTNSAAGGLRFAVRLPTSNRVADPEAIVDVAVAAEELGFWAVSVHDHLVFNGAWVACGAAEASGRGDDRDMYEALTTLAFVAARTSSVRLLTAILLLPVREVVLAAKQVATIDALSGGRIVLGVGIGAGGGGAQAGSPIKLGDHLVNANKENATFGVPVKRGALVNEQLAAMRRIWTDDRASFAGSFVTLDQVEVFPKPAQPGGPAVLIGGGSQPAIRRAAQHGDGWLPTALDPGEYAAGVERLARLSAEAGRPEPRLHGLNIFAAVGADDEAAMAVAAPTLSGRFDSDQIRERNLIGGPEAVIRRLREYQAAGLELLELKPIYRSVDDLIEMLRLIAEEVMPAFAGPSAGG